MLRHEVLWPVQLADQGRDAVQRNLGAVAPGAGRQHGRASDEQAHGCRPGRRVERQPRLPAPEMDGRVAPTVPQRTERCAEIEGRAQLEAALDHRRMERRIGADPACTASNSVRLRIPR
jgi:hypothetical protein